MSLRRLDSAATVVARLDRLTLREPVSLPTGGRRLDAVIAHVGPLVYTHADDPTIPRGRRRVELVRADTLADPGFLGALAGLPVTVEHVPGATTRNMQRVRVGTILSARFDAATGDLTASLVVDDERGLQALRQGLTGVSLGYDVELDERPGDWTAPDGTTHRYDAVQVRRTPNHLALTTRGRASRAHVRTDHGDRMDPVALALALAGLGITIDPATATPETVRDAVRSRHDALVGERDAARTELATVTAARADAETRATELEALRRGDGEAFRAALATRKRYDALAARFGVKDAAGMDTTALGRAIVGAAKVPGLSATPSDDEVRIALGLLEQQPARDTRFDAAREPKRETRADAPASGGGWSNVYKPASTT